MWLMEFVVGQTAQSLTCSIVEKLQTGLDDCLNMLLSRFRKRMSADGGREGEPRLRSFMAAAAASRPTATAAAIVLRF